MEYLIGLILSVAVAGFATAIGLDRERAFYPTVLIVIASYYVLFAVMGGSSRACWSKSLWQVDFSYLLYSDSRGAFGSLLLPLLATEFLILSIIGLLKTRVYRVGGLVSV